MRPLTPQAVPQVAGTSKPQELRFCNSAGQTVDIPCERVEHEAVGWIPKPRAIPTPLLRYASAANSTVENLLRGRRPLAGVGFFGTAVAMARLPGDVAHLEADLEKPNGGADAGESAARVGRNFIRASRGAEHLVRAFGSRAAEHLMPGANGMAAVLDSGIALADAANPRCTTKERELSWLAAAASTVSATNVPYVAQAAGITAACLGVWRDALSDRRRAEEPDAPPIVAG